MNVAAFAVRRYQFTLVIFAMLALLGLNTLVTMPKAEDPSFAVPVVSVVAVLPGASPVELEQQVLIPIERRLRELSDIKEIRAAAEDGVASVIVEFLDGVDIDRKYSDVVREMAAVRAELPAELYSLETDQFSTTDVVVWQFALLSETADYRVLDDQTDRLRELLDGLPGIKETDIYGVPESEVRVSLDLARMAPYGLSPGEVVAALQLANAQIPLGAADAGGRRFNLKPAGKFASLDAIRALPVRSTPLGALTVGDLAEVAWDHGDHNHVTRLNGRRGAFVTAALREGTDIFQTKAAMAGPLDDFVRSLPAGMTLETVFDQSLNVAKRLNGLGTDFLIAIGLVVVTLLPLGLRASVVVMISIPLSLAVGLIALDLMGYNLNQLTIVGLVIALGLVVDDSIVVVENIARFLREGKSKREAAIAATSQITVAVVGATAILILSFLPLALLPGGSGNYIRSLPMAVITSVLGSLLVALTIIPFLSALLLKREEEAGGNPFLRLLERFLHVTYSPVLALALRHRWATVGVSVGLVAASGLIVPALGFSLFPKAEMPQFLVTLELPAGAPRSATDAAAREVETFLLAEEEVATVAANVGRSNPEMFYNIIGQQPRPNYAELLVTLDHYDTRATPVYLSGLRQRLDAAWPGVRVEAVEFVNGPPIEAPIAVRIFAEDLGQLRAQAAEVERVLLGVEGTQYVNNPLRLDRLDLQVVVDPRRAAQAGVALQDVDLAVRTALAGLPAGEFRASDGEGYTINVSLPRGDEAPLAILDEVYLPRPGQLPIPLRHLAELTLVGEVPLIQRFNRERFVAVTAYVRDGFNTGALTDETERRLRRLEWPEGVRFRFAGEVQSREESFGGVGNAIIFTVFATLAVLILEFKSFQNTLIVASVIPLGVMGGLAALLLTGNSISFTSTIGFVALIGIEIKTSILLVDLTNQLRREGMEIVAAVQKAGEVRFVPILLTSATAIGGLLPIALGNAALYAPLAWVIIGGLVSSTLFARVVTPVLYLLVKPQP